MRHITFVFFIITILISCKNAPKDERFEVLKRTLDTISFNNTDSYFDYRSFIVENKYVKTYKELCKIDSIKAQIDIEKNKLTFFIGYNKHRYFSSLKELPNILKEKYNINTIDLLTSCLINDSTSYEECYERLMHKAIETVKGNGFINKVKRTTDSIYHHKNSNKIYSTKNSYAMFQRMISKDYQKWKDSISFSFSKKITLPKNYVLKGDKITYIYAGFIINKNGSIDSLETYSQNIDKKYQTFFEKETRKYIQKTKWLPFEIYGIKLNSKEHFFLQL